MRPVVLFVDDEPNILSGLKRSTRVYADQWDMLFAPGGREALQILEQAQVNALVTDMRMPGMDGAQLLETVTAQWPGMYRMALSGEADIELSCRIVGLSHRFLSKPCAHELIHQSIQAPLDLIAANGDFTFERSRSLFSRLTANPGTFARLQALADSDNPSHSDVAAVIMGDPSVAVRILQIANSAYFGRPFATLDIARAVTTLGLTRIFSLVSFNRLGAEHPATSETAIAASRPAQAALIARAQAARNGASNEQLAVAYATALFADLIVDDPAIPSKWPAYICALFGLPDPLVQSLLQLSPRRAACTDASQLGQLAASCALAPSPHMQAEAV